jgi:peptidoglycan/xylan/chitin deacetylase (PgdA/CDA1 family)
VTYSVWDSSGNKAVVQRTIRYDDPVAPVITLEGDNPVWLEEGQNYEEQGYSAYDQFDGDLTAQVQVAVGEDAVTYRVTDAHGNVTEVTRQLLYEDLEAPVITLLGESVVTMKIGTAYAEPGFTAADNRDGDLTTSVEVSGSVQKYLAASYTLTYTVRDEAGNETSVERTVVVEPMDRVETVYPDGKIIYLTFDDGPGGYTQRLLDILAKYNVKATFFVVGTGSVSLLDDIVDQGHSIAIHAYSHDYKKIYASEDAYFEDLLSMQQLIYDHTGVWTTLIRFPGGSSNTVSRFNPGVMSRLTKAVQDMGFQYFDWNVDSNDAGGARDAATVAANVIAGCSVRRVSVVLQHDIKGYSVDAVEQIIQWGLANGYTFLPMDPSSPTMHHGINN